MSTLPSESDTRCGAMQVHLLGRIDFQCCLELQQRLVAHMARHDDGRITLLLAEHPPVVTIGRGGCPRHLIALSGVLRKIPLEVRWVNRGGGCMLHAPGQLAVYPLVPLRWYGLSVGEYLRRLHQVLEAAMHNFRVRTAAPNGPGLWGRCGQLASVGIAVRNWVTYQGAFVNVEPSLGLLRLVETGSTRFSSLVAEVGRSAKMTSVRAALIEQFAAAFDCERYHINSGVPVL